MKKEKKFFCAKYDKIFKEIYCNEKNIYLIVKKLLEEDIG